MVASKNSLLVIVFVAFLVITNSHGSRRKSSYMLVPSPRPARVYANSASGLDITQIIYRRWGTQKPSCFPRYFITNENHTRFFHVDECTGLVTTNRYVDMPIGFVYSLQIQVMDDKDRQLTINKLNIEVTSYNSKRPQLTEKQYSTEILKNSRKTALLTTITATDNDTESYNRELYYFLQDDSNKEKDPLYYKPNSSLPFYIDLEKGEIRLRSSLQNVSSPLNFTVGVADGGSPRRNSSAEIIVHIRDMPAPENILITKTTNDSISVCWSPPDRGEPELYVITYHPQTAPRLQYRLNITNKDLDEGEIGYPYQSKFLKDDDEEQQLISIFSDDFYPTICYDITENLFSYTNYIVNVEAYAQNEISMTNQPIEAFTNYRSCYLDNCGEGKGDGICQETDFGYRCKCLKGNSGSNCDKKTCTRHADCRNGGVCRRLQHEGHTCSCSEGYSGENCGHADICVNHLCLHGGSCLINPIARDLSSEDRGYVCSCSFGYSGSNCEIIDPCYHNSPCVNNSPCGQSTNGTVYCQCRPNYTGLFCEIFNNTMEETSATCPPDTLYTDKGTFVWPETVAGEIATLSCPYGAKLEEERVTVQTQSTLGRPKRSSPSWYRIHKLRGIRVRSVSLRRQRRSALTSTAPTEGSMNPQWSRTYDILPATEIPEVVVTRRCWTNINTRSSLWYDADIGDCKSNIEAALDSDEDSDEDDDDDDLIVPPAGAITSDSLAKSVRRISRAMTRALNNTKAAQRVVEALSNLLNANRSIYKSSDPQTTNSGSQIFDALSSYTANVHLVPGGEPVRLRADNLVVEAKLISKKNLPDEISFNPFGGSSNPEKNLSTSDLLKKIFINIPKVAALTNSEENVRFQFIYFKDDRIFKSVSSFLDMPVVVAMVSNTSVKNLATPVTYHIPINNSSMANKTLTCVFWDERGKVWSTDGLTTERLNDELICQSDHLTSFSILLDPFGTPMPPTSYSKVLSVISHIGLSISMVALLITILTFGLFKSVNGDRSGLIVMNLSIALEFLYIGFLIAIYTNVNSKGCFVVGALVHYAMVASFAWMLLEAQNMFQLLVTIFPSSETHFMLKRLAFGWGLPLLLVIIALLWNTKVYENHTAEYCMINPTIFPAIYYTTYIVPIVLVLSVNMFVFIKVARILCQRRPTYAFRNEKAPKKSRPHTLSVTPAQIKGTITIVALLGITWVLALLAVDQLYIRPIIQFCFCVTTPLQGLIIFIVRVLQNAEARTAWMTFLTTGSRRRRNPQQISSVRTHSSCQNSSSINTSSTGMTPSSLFASAIRKLSIGTSSFSQQKSSNGSSIFYAMSFKKNRQSIKREASNSVRATAVDKATYENNEKRHSFLLDKDASVIYESLETECLRDLRAMFSEEQLFHKPDLIENLDEERIKIACSDIDNRELYNGLGPRIGLVNQRNIASMSDLNPTDSLKKNDRNSTLHRSMGSLIGNSSTSSDTCPIRLTIDFDDSTDKVDIHSSISYIGDYKISLENDPLLPTSQNTVSMRRPTSCLNISSSVPNSSDLRQDLKAKSVEGLYIYPPKQN